MNMFQGRMRFLVVLCFLIFSSSGVQGRALVSVGEKSPTFKGTSLSGASVNFSDWTASSPALLVFYSINIQSCLPILTDLERMFREFERPPARILGISLDIDAKSVISALSREDLAIPTILDPEFEIASHFGVSAPPVVIFVDQQQKVKAVYTKWSGETFDALRRTMSSATGIKLRSKTPVNEPGNLIDKILISPSAMWSAPVPNSRRILYLTPKNELFLFEPNTSRRAVLSTAAVQPSISRDGLFLVYRNTGDGGIYMVNLDSVVFPRDPRDASAPTVPTIEIADKGFFPDISPDGDLVVYGVEGGGIYMKDMKNNKRRKIFKNGIMARFSSDGLLLIVSDEKGSIWITQNHLKPPESVF